MRPEKLPDAHSTDNTSDGRSQEALEFAASLMKRRKLCLEDLTISCDFWRFGCDERDLGIGQVEENCWRHDDGRQWVDQMPFNNLLGHDANEVLHLVLSKRSASVLLYGC